MKTLIYFFSIVTFFVVVTADARRPYFVGNNFIEVTDAVYYKRAKNPRTEPSEIYSIHIKSIADGVKIRYLYFGNNEYPVPCDVYLVKNKTRVTHLSNNETYEVKGNKYFYKNNNVSPTEEVSEELAKYPEIHATKARAYILYTFNGQFYYAMVNEAEEIKMKTRKTYR